jgi:hypothetical protein
MFLLIQKFSLNSCNFALIRQVFFQVGYGFFTMGGEQGCHPCAFLHQLINGVGNQHALAIVFQGRERTPGEFVPQVVAMFFQVIEGVFDVPPHAPAPGNVVAVRIVGWHVGNVGKDVFFFKPRVGSII